MASSIGYQTIKKTVSIQRSGTIDFTLEENTVALTSIEVYGKSQTQKMREGALAANVLDVKPIINSLNSLNDLMNRTAGVKVREEGSIGSNEVA